MFCGRLRPIATSKINDGRLEGIRTSYLVVSGATTLIFIEDLGSIEIPSRAKLKHLSKQTKGRRIPKQ